jgi:hypothetical protein
VLAVIQTVLASLGLLLCIALMLRMALPEKRRQRLDAFVFDAWHRMVRGLRHIGRRRALRREAQQAADQAIRRAREVRRDGNVYRPQSFKQPPKH